MKNIIGHKFSRLTVTKFAGQDKHHNSKWVCICSCGNTKIVTGNSLKTGGVKSCGCLFKEYLEKQRKIMTTFNLTHGLSKTSEYRAWQNMKDRCYNPNCHCFCDYGGRGIKVCNSWLESFEIFYKDMGPKPCKTSLDRIDNQGNYCFSNCKWTTAKEQNHNRRKNGTGRRSVHKNHEN